MYLYHCDTCGVHFSERVFLSHFQKHHPVGATISKMLYFPRGDYNIHALPISADRLARP